MVNEKDIAGIGTNLAGRIGNTSLDKQDNPIVALQAGPGMGKSTLLDEIAKKNEKMMEIFNGIKGFRDKSVTLGSIIKDATMIPIGFGNTTPLSPEEKLDAEHAMCVRILYRYSVL